MQKFYTDKPKIFECSISVSDGVALNETKTRLLLEFPNKRNLLFHGKINENGKCEILVPALKDIAECEGNAVLEVIAEETYFEPWNDKFKLETNKKVVVEVTDKEDRELILAEDAKPQIAVVIKEEVVKPEQKKVEENRNYLKFKTYLKENNIRITSVIKNKKKFLTLLREYKLNTKASKEEVILIVEEIQREVKLLKS